MKLEAELEELLFERTKREVKLTPAGELFRIHAERVLDEVETARERVRETRGQLRGRVALGALPTVAPYFLPQRLRLFVRLHPDIEVVVHEDTTAQLAAAVAAKEIDLALVSLPVERRGLVSEEFLVEELRVAMPEGHPLAARKQLALPDLEPETFILMKEGHCLAGQALQFCHLHGFTPQVSFRSAQIETVLAFVAAGWGLSIVPEMACGAAPRRGVTYRRVPGLKRSVGIIRRASATPSRATAALIAFLRNGSATP